MRFIHIADLHLDSTFDNLSNKNNLGERRRLEQRQALKNVIEYAKENKIEYIFVAGDLYEHEHIKQSSIEYINKLFQEIPDTKIFISPGNHDPYTVDSMYANFAWNDNVYIFSKYELECMEQEDCYIYGVGFTSFSETELDIQVELKKDKPQILLMHANLDGGKISDGNEYNPIKSATLKNAHFDYVALGHIHKRNIDNNIVYPGSLVSLGFDEPDEHGMIVGTIEEGKLDLEFVPIDTRKFKQIELDVKDIVDEQELIEKLNNYEYIDNTMYEIYLVGKRAFDIDVNKIMQFVEVDNLLKVKDKTQIAYDLEKISNENTLKGIFVKKALDKINQDQSNREEVEKAIEIVLNLMK